MERISKNSNGYRLESQIREAYGRVVYTETCHYKMIDRLQGYYDTLKLCRIILSAATTSGILASIVFDKACASIIGAILAFILLVINTYFKEADWINKITNHQHTANQLWKIREAYVSLLTDFDILDGYRIRLRRDELQQMTGIIYDEAPNTDSQSYKEAQIALKFNEEQTFSDDEIDHLLPNSLRRNTRHVID